MDYLASMYIDDELDLDDKVVFLDKVHGEPPFYRSTRELLLMEKMLRKSVDTSLLPDHPPMRRPFWHGFGRFLRPLIFTGAGWVAASIMMLVFYRLPSPATVSDRFVIYAPSAHQVELTGTFTDWQRTPLQPVGGSGYWAVRLPVPVGEHRFAYILDGERQMADPTLPGREQDDFGGENSILKVEGRV